jgi:hypothetical protein
MENLKFIRPNECDLGENWEDYFLEIRSIKKGELFYECERGYNYQLKALEDAKRTRDGWYCKAQNTRNEVIELFVSADTQHHVPNLFRAPQYLTCDEEKGSVYFIH